MPKIVRMSTFETNSSSAHSLVISKSDELLNEIPEEILLKPFDCEFEGEPCNARIYSSVEDKLNYVLASIMEHLSDFELSPILVKLPDDLKDLIENGNPYDPENFDLTQYLGQVTEKYIKDGKLITHKLRLSRTGYRLWNKLVSSVLGKVKINVKTNDEFFEYCIPISKTEEEEKSFKVFHGDVNNIFDLAWSEFSYLPLEFPIPLSCLLNFDLMKRFILNPKSYVRIGTDNGGYPIDPSLLPNNEEWFSPDSYYHMKKILKDWDIIYNGSKLSVDGKKVKYNNV